MDYSDVQRAYTLSMQRKGIQITLDRIASGDSDFLMRIIVGTLDTPLTGVEPYMGCFPINALDIENHYVIDMLEAKINDIDVELGELGVTGLPGEW